MSVLDDSAHYLVDYRSGAEKVIAFCSLLVAGCLVALVLFGTYERKVELTGFVFPENGQVNVSSRFPGQIEAIHVVDQQYVNKGTVLFDLSFEKATPSGNSQSQISELIKKTGSSLDSEYGAIWKRYKEQKANLSENVENKAQQIDSIKKQMEIADSSIKNLQSLVQTYDLLVQSKDISTNSWLEKRNELNVEKNKRENLNLQKLQLEKEVISLNGEARDLDQRIRMDSESANREAIKNSKEALLSEASLHETFIAPIDGYVTGLAIKNGQYIASGKVVLGIVPKESEFDLEMTAPSKDIAFIREKASIKILYDAFPYQKFGIYQGAVKTVSLSALPTSNEQDRDVERYRIVAKIHEPCVMAYGRCEGIKPGMKARVLIATESRSIASWIFNPMYSLVGQ